MEEYQPDTKGTAMITAYRAPSMITSSVPLADHYDVCDACNIAKSATGVCDC